MSTGRRALSLWPIVCVACILCSLTGCSGARKGPVSGTVTFDGKPLKRGKLNFYGAKGKTAETCEIEDGEFTLKNCPLGDGVKVCVLTEHLKTAGQDVERLQREIDALERSKPPAGLEAPPDIARSLEEKKERKKVAEADAKAYVKIPDNYSKQENTPLTMTIKSGDKLEIKVEK